MATPGIPYELTEETKQYAIKYVEEGGFFKNRLADFLSISRPTLDRVLEENEDFFTAIRRADAIYCKSKYDQRRNCEFSNELFKSLPKDIDFYKNVKILQWDYQ